MKRFIKAITAGAFSVVLALSAAASTAVLNADAASMGDVISKAREIGMPESEIQGYISQYGGRDYTSDQYQQAVNALEGMRGKYSGGNSNNNNSSDETSPTLFPEDTTDGATGATNSKEVDDFFNKSSEDKIKYIQGLTDDEAKKFWDELTDEQKKTVGEVLNADSIDDLKKSAEKAAAELGISDTTTEETTEEATETEAETESVSESEAETESETAEVIAKTTNTMIWVVVCVIIGVAVIFAVIACVMKKSNKKE
ncbi:MAG: hypothetical protein MRZ46_00885 [Oscillospiraceae bacterium]|nr:hypothetical protein [Oscillospiraceae bacterium]MDY3257320.1 hypothetical protein [Ruminococcus callidus]